MYFTIVSYETARRSKSFCVEIYIYSRFRRIILIVSYQLHYAAYNLRVLRFLCSCSHIIRCNMNNRSWSLFNKVEGGDLEHVGNFWGRVLVVQCRAVHINLIGLSFVDFVALVGTHASIM